MVTNETIKIVCDCALKYEEELANRDLLFICKDKHNKVSYFEFSFHRQNFMHLTGLKEINSTDNQRLSAADFFSRCLNRKLSPKDFNLSKDGTGKLKLDVLPYLMNGNLSAKMIGDFANGGKKLKTEKLAGNVNACMGFVTDKQSLEMIPNTVLKENVVKASDGYVQVIATYRKKFDENTYSEITYINKKASWEKLKFPEDFRYLEEQTKEEIKKEQ